MASPAAVQSPTGAAASRVRHNILHLMGGQAMATAAAVVWLYFVPRAIGPGGVGVIAIATSVSGLMSILLNSGVGVLVTRDVARHPDRAGSLTGSGLILRMLGVPPALVFLAVYIHVLHVSGEEATVIWLGGAVALTSAASGVIQAAFQGLEQMRYLAYANALGNALVRLSAIAVVLVGLGVVAIVQANVALTLLVLVLNLWWMRGHFTLSLRPRPAELRYLLTASVSLWVGALIFSAYLWIDTVILSTLAPVEVVGWYNTPTQIFAALLTVPGMIGVAWFPRFARAFTEGAESLRRTARPALEAIVLLSLPMGVGLACIARPLIRALYGPSFGGAGWTLAILAITMIPTFFNMMAYQVLLASDRQMAWIRVVLVATLVNIALNVLLIGWFQSHHGNGALGAATSLLVTEVLESVCAVLLLTWVVNRRFLGRLVRGLLATTVMGGLVVLAGLLEDVGLGIPGHWGLAGHLGLAVQLTVGAVSFGLLALLLRLPGETEMAALRGLGARLRRAAGAAG